LKKIRIILPPKKLQDQIGKKIKEAVEATALTRTKIGEADKEIQNLI
jgi:restriction endonuclease S subunit